MSAELINRLRRASDLFRAGPFALLMTQAADRIEELEPKVRCDYIFSCGCRCQRDHHIDEEHQR